MKQFLKKEYLNIYYLLDYLLFLLKLMQKNLKYYSIINCLVMLFYYYFN